MYMATVMATSRGRARGIRVNNTPSYLVRGRSRPLNRQYYGIKDNCDNSRKNRSDSENLCGQNFEKPSVASVLENENQLEIVNEEAAVICSPPRITRQTPLDHETALWLNKLRHVFGLLSVYNLKSIFIGGLLLFTLLTTGSGFEYKRYRSFQFARGKKSEAVTKILREYFESVVNPYSSALKIASNCPDFYQSKTVSLPFTVFEELKNFMKSYKRRDHYVSCLTPEIKMEAFNTLIKQSNTTLSGFVFHVFELEKHKQMFIEPIRRMAESKDYRQACLFATALGLENEYPIKMFVIPLIFQDKCNVAEGYISQSKRHQMDLVRFLDDLISFKNIRNQIDIIIQDLGIPEPKLDKLVHRTLVRLLSRLKKTYNISDTCCPNLSKRRGESALYFLINKRFRENSLGLASWHEMVLETVGNNRELQAHLVNHLNGVGDVNEAVYWAMKFNLYKIAMPYRVRRTIELGTFSITDDHFFNTPEVDSENYHSLRIPLSNVLMVDSEAEMQKMIDEGLSTVDIVGVDTEWKPVFGSAPNNMSIIQIATYDKVYLIDVIALNSSKLWGKLGAVLFANQNILKLGFGLVYDLNLIKEKLSTHNMTFDGNGYLDVGTLWKRLTRNHSLIMPFSGDEKSSVEGLSKLVSVCFGKPLYKADQFSNWNRRPLRFGQKAYAALDAFCLLEAYQKLYELSEEQGIPFTDICNEIMSEGRSRKAQKNKASKPSKPETSDMPPSPNKEPVPVSWLKVVCDTMLQGLGKQLRKCGVDTAILNNNDSHTVCVMLAKNEKRVILTTGHVYAKLYENVPLGYCYRVDNKKPEDQLVEVLNYYNVFVTRDDIFTRCQLCNCDVFERLTPTQLEEAIKTYYTHNARTRYSNYDQFDDDFDDADGDDDNYEDSNCYSDESQVSDTDYPCLPIESDFVKSRPQHSEKCLKTYTGYGEGCQTNSGAHIKFEAIPKDVFSQVPTFYICDTCGHCYWDGSHYDRVLAGKLRNIVVQ